MLEAIEKIEGWGAGNSYGYTDKFYVNITSRTWVQLIGCVYRLTNRAIKRAYAKFHIQDKPIEQFEPSGCEKVTSFK